MREPIPRCRCVLGDGRVGASAVLIAHNHPSGDLSPSAEDREVTQRLIDAGKLLGIPLLDQVVVTNDGYYAMREQLRDWFETD